MNNSIFEHIDRARQYSGSGAPLTEAQIVEKQTANTRQALETAKRLRESRQPESEPVRMQAMPVPN